MGIVREVASTFGITAPERADKEFVPNGVSKLFNVRCDANSVLDLFRSGEPFGKTAVIIHFNGNSFHKSSRIRASTLCSILSKRDYTVINCEFRNIKRSNDAKDCVEDVSHIFKWISDHADEYALDLGRVYVTGSSYGALMAFWTALLCNTERFGQALGITGPRFKIKGLGLFTGMTDTESGDRIMRSISKAITRTETSDGGYRDHNLSNAFRPCRNHDLRTLPPVYQVTGDLDSAMPDVMRMDALLDSNGVVHETLEFQASDRLTNGFMEDRASSNECARALSRMFNFFDSADQ